MTTKGWIIFAAICVVLFGGLLFWSQRDRIDVSNIDANKIQAADDMNGSIADHVKGNKDAKVTLIEYGDFQCPGCGAAYPRVKALNEQYGNDIAFVYRNFPLTNIHPNARAAAAAAEAAGLQGKYWEMHDALFDNQDEWSSASAEDRTRLFEKYAGEIGINTEKFTGDLRTQSADINRKISFDQALGRKVEVSSTPTFFLNGTKLAEEQISEESFEKTIRDELEKSGVELPEPAASNE